MGISEIVETFLKGWSNNLSVLLPVFAEEVVYADQPLRANLKGKAEVESFANAFFTAFPDIRFELASTPIEAGNRCSFEWRITGTHLGLLLDKPATGKAIDFQGISTMEVKDGKIVRITDYWDLATLLRQIGHMPA